MQRHFLILIALVLALALLFHQQLLRGLGELLTLEAPLVEADAAVVLSGPEYIARLDRAARLYAQGQVAKVVVNGDRRDQGLDWLYSQGYRDDRPWDASTRSILIFLGVPNDKILAISAPDVFDTVSEAELVGTHLLDRHLRRITVVTSRYHTARAHRIWRQRWAGDLTVGISGATRDGFAPEHWWQHGRFAKAVLAELGGYLFYWLRW
jgi:uncharacterized SAM-binding protein YcdF (DUF218 family)